MLVKTTPTNLTKAKVMSTPLEVNHVVIEFQHMWLVLCVFTGGRSSGDNDQINQYDDNNGGFTASFVCYKKSVCLAA